MRVIQANTTHTRAITNTASLLQYENKAVNQNVCTHT